MGYVAWSVVFGEQPSASKWNILGQNDASFNDGSGIGDSAITPEKLYAGTGTDWAWDSYTPTFANTTLGSGTVTGKYIQIGRTVHFWAKFTLGAGSAMGTSPTVTLPVTSTTLDNTHFLGLVDILDANVGHYLGFAYWNTTSTAGVFSMNSAGTYGIASGVTATIPMTWTSTDSLTFRGTYEV